MKAPTSLIGEFTGDQYPIQYYLAKPGKGYFKKCFPSLRSTLASFSHRLLSIVKSARDVQPFSCGTWPRVGRRYRTPSQGCKSMCLTFLSFTSPSKTSLFLNGKEKKNLWVSHFLFPSISLPIFKVFGF